MIILGLTGPSGAGKTAFSRILTKKGFPCINADELYHSMLKPPSVVLDAIRDSFGDSFFNENGELDRKALGKFVFSSSERLDKLNATVLPLVTQRMKSIAESFEANGAKLLIIDAPTLFEAGYDKSCDVTVSVLASPLTRIERISKRDGISRDDAILRIKAQKDDSFYRERSDRVIMNDSSEDKLRQSAEALLNELFGEKI